MYAEVQQFYGRHMQLLDAGDGEGWARTFTEDGVFAPPSSVPVRGRAALAEGVRAAHARLVEAGEVHRHLLSMISVAERDDGVLSARSYAQIVATPRDGSPRLHLMCVCEDLLVRENGELLIRERRVTRDDRVEAPSARRPGPVRTA
ncbi:nuclear transport factor 2 family protein [Spirillospora sp. NBC_00431]